ncbi:Mitochondrial import inner membrane translocase subunit Tim10 [Dinochytrium kinnereticum]|nr:Mitochondrial import inner membrane translocase subunit Tim10 [Dinochytrium kinnereticum]
MDPSMLQNIPEWQAEFLMEIEADVKRRISFTCHKKCISPHYHQDGELNKGESVCVDRCVSKWFMSKAFMDKKGNELNVAYQQK